MITYTVKCLECKHIENGIINSNDIYAAKREHTVNTGHTKMIVEV
jgi:hypothetical protein